MASRSSRGARLKAPFLKRVTLREEKVVAGEFPFTLPWLARGLDLALEHEVTFVVGDNGAGKSTFIEAIAEQCGLGPRGGTADHGRPDAGSEETRLAPALRLAWLPKVRGFFFRAETFFDLAGHLDALSPGADAARELLQLSHGEGYLAFIESRLERYAPALFLFDEPESALAPESQLELLAIIERMRRTGQAQFVIATHSPILVALPGAEILLFNHRGIHKTRLEDVPHLRWYREFLEDPKGHVAAYLDERLGRDGG